MATGVRRKQMRRADSLRQYWHLRSVSIEYDKNSEWMHAHMHWWQGARQHQLSYARWRILD